jgi:hypothetical protein
MSFYSDASLVLIPSGYKDQKVYCAVPTDGAADLVFSRASSATRVASNGLIEKVRTNLALYSEQLDNAYWIKAGSPTITVTANAGTAPDGTTTADRCSATSVATSSRVYTTTTWGGGEYTLSLYVKNNGGTNTNFRFSYYDSVSQYFSPTITLTNEWQRVTYTFTPAAGAGGFWLVNTPSESGNLDLLAWGAQLETGVATDYIATTSAAVSVGPVSGLPRLDYLNSTCPRLLLEPQRTNSQINSENFASWLGIDNITISSNTTDTFDPSGYNGSDKITLLGGAPMRVYEFTGSSAGTGTISLFVKAGTTPTIALFTSSSSLLVNFNLSTQVVTPTTGTGTITSYGNGWYRITATATLGSNEVLQILFVGSAGQTMYIWGAQVEAGAYATSYIPTLGTSVTRVADAAFKTSASALIGQTEGTLFAEVEVINTMDNIGIWMRQSGSLYDNIILMFINGTRNSRLQILNGGVTQADITGPVVSAGFHKIAAAYKANDFVLYVDGVQVGLDAAGSVPTCNEIYIDNYIDANARNATKKQALVFKTRLSNSDLAALTA